MDGDNMSLWMKIRAYKLTSNISIICTLWVYGNVNCCLHSTTNNKIITDLSLAFATSLLASIFCLASETYVRYRTYENDKCLEGIEALGIADLHFDKQKLLVKLLTDCNEELWISGYRLILTSQVARYLTKLPVVILE